ncbi:His-Xaa-Ser system radical SAM maturase HxsB [Shewanella dokdonensis]|uniref:His-Xaa-Ser system radical SAM maturase HxsB n=1 Tax=Shewanella dokdonensis TaxID=712036 RepID=UPI00200D1DC5|nr:His-Xaa-Ser system radical SAM maturase HxsB [Shewanella dokdonensis]MCL1073106.1 His-Xaa-Ser system radical SAM maturase HxsB [Shewanella dokdonensis]
MRVNPPHTFSALSYQLLPFRFERINDDLFLLVNEVGENCYLNFEDLNDLIDGRLVTSGKVFQKLESKSFIYSENNNFSLRAFSAKYKARKSFLFDGPALHIFVLTLKCENSCEYCQVTRRSPDTVTYDMPLSIAKQAVLRMFESPAKNLTVEFQGGEPLLAFETLRYIVELCIELNETQQKNLQFVVATSLQNIDMEMLNFFHIHNIHISTSVDGPKWLHQLNRPNSCSNSYEKTICGLEMARSVLENDRIAGMTTITRSSLSEPKAIIDEYVRLGFHSIFLRPLNMYGFAVKKENKVGYSSDEFNKFYEQALKYIIKVNQQGYRLDEVNAVLALNNILTPRATGYVDMRSPCGDGTGVLVYNYDGKVYPSDESRMLVEMGDKSLALGSVNDPYQELISSSVLNTILQAGIAEALPGCSDCAYLPYCGANPIQNYSRYGDMIGHRAFSAFCAKQKFLYRYIFKLLDDKSHRAVFNSWLPHSICQTTEEALTNG